MTSDEPIEPPPRVLISYAWEDAAHNQWVKDLGTKLRTDGVDIILDAWSTALGDRLPYFMEEAVRDSDFVVYICTPEYKRKSDHRIRGVGYEGNVITAELYATSNERKFIPVLRKGNLDDATPTWSGGKRGVDLRGDPYLKDMELQLQGIDASYRGKADTNIDVAKGKRLKMILLENMVRRLQAERRTAKAWHLQRQVYKIEREGRVLTALQRQMDEVNDIEAERAALREDERRKER